MAEEIKDTDTQAVREISSESLTAEAAPVKVIMSGGSLSASVLE